MRLETRLLLKQVLAFLDTLSLDYDAQRLCLLLQLGRDVPPSEYVVQLVRLDSRCHDHVPRLDWVTDRQHASLGWVL
jgi:hypothetical protein